MPLKRHGKKSRQLSYVLFCLVALGYVSLGSVVLGLLGLVAFG